MWQISGPPATVAYLGNYIHIKISQDTNFNFYEKNCQFIVWGPKLQAVRRNRGSANRPKMDQFENFSIIYCTKSKLKGGQFYEKNANSCILGPILWAVLDILRGVCQSAHNWPIWKFLNNFLHKIQIQKGSVLCKKSPTHVFEATFCGPFWKMGGLPIGPELTDLKVF